MRYRNGGAGTVTVERQKLYEQVWSIPGATLAIQYGISDVGLAKACKRYRIPRPPRGYWARLEAGQKVQRDALPPISDTACEIVIMQGWNLPDGAVQRLVSGAKPPRRPVVEQLPEQPMHPLIGITRAQLLAAKPDIEGMIQSDAATGLAVKLAPASIDRCMTILNRLIDTWQDRGGEVRPGTGDTGIDPLTTMALGPDCLGIRVFEGLDETRPITDPMRITGKLHLLITGEDRQQFRRRWSETKTQRLDRMINPLVETMAHSIEVARLWRLDHECVKRQELRAQNRRQAVANIRAREFNWRRQLISDAGRWHEARSIREYLDAVKSALDAGEVKPREPDAFEQWFEWAHSYADFIDPVRRAVIPVETIDGPANTPSAELDLTSGARQIIGTLGVRDSDALALKGEDEVRGACNRGAGAVWNEITRVLEGLGYDVSRRAEAKYWW
jgi:hypothetical protein